MKRRFINIFKSTFFKNVLIMSTGAASAQAIVAGLSPIITRIYGPEAFGIMGTFNSMVAIIVPLAALTYPVAIVLPKSNNTAKGLIRLSLIISCTIAFLSLLVLIFFNDQIINIFHLKEISWYLYLIPMAIIFGGLVQVTEQWLIRTNQFTVNARVNFLQSLFINLSKIGIGSFYPVASVLVTLTAIGDGLRASMMIFFAKKPSLKEGNKNEIKKQSIMKLAKEYRDFPIYRAPESFFSKFSQSLPVLMLTAFFGPASAGFYTLGRTVLAMPSRLIGNAVGDVFYPRIAEAVNNNENATKLIKKATIALAGVGILPFGMVIIFGPFLFSFVFGEEWIIAGEYARWIALWSYSNFFNKPSVRALAALGAQKFHLIYTIFSFIIRTLVLLFGFYVFSSDIIAIALFGIFGSILNLGLIKISLNISKNK